MKIEVKNIYEKMIDFHRFASVLLGFGVFFYFGMIIPQETATTVTKLVSAGGSIISLAISILFFYLSKKLKKKLEESEEGQQYLMKK
jgi:preprotein translocase subunit YajC